MLSPEPAWNLRTEAPLTQWYGHVRLLEDSVLGQWVRVALSTGEHLWEGSYERANHICGVTHDTIIATEMYSGGPWTATFGVYGIDLGNGEPLWANHGDRLGGLLRALDRVGLFANRWRDSPELVTEDGVWTHDGRVLDPRTGVTLDPPPVRPIPLADPRDRSRTFYFGRELELGQGRRLVRLRSDQLCALRVAVVDTEGGMVWQRDWVRGVHGNYYSHRIVGEHLVVIVNGTEAALEVVRLADGETIQHLHCPGDGSRPARIEDADDRGVLVSDSRHELHWYPLIPEGLYRQPAP